MANPRRTHLKAPRPLAWLGRVLGLPVRAVVAYWSQERVAVRRGMSALLLAGITGMLAGLMLAKATQTLTDLPGLLLLVPAAIDMRGNIYGALASRLSTAIHLGEYEREIRWRGFLGRQIEATSLLTVGTSVVIAVLAWIFAGALGLSTISLWHLIVIATVGGTLSSALLLVVTIVLSRIAHRREWNMDDVAAPTITVAGDALTVPALLGATLLIRNGTVATVLGVILAIVGLGCLVIGGWRRQGTVRRIVRESTITLAIAAGVGTLAGAILETRLADLVASPWLLLLIPPFIATCGSLGGMLSSRLASKLHLGVIEPRWLPTRPAWLDASLSLLFGVFACTVLALTTWIAAYLSDLQPPSLLVVLNTALLAGVISVFLLVAVAHLTATASYRFGLDPDNEGIPIVTSAMDLLGLLTLSGVVTLLQIG